MEDNPKVTMDIENNNTSGNPQRAAVGCAEGRGGVRLVSAATVAATVILPLVITRDAAAQTCAPADTGGDAGDFADCMECSPTDSCVDPAQGTDYNGIQDYADFVSGDPVGGDGGVGGGGDGFGPGDDRFGDSASIS